MFEVQILEPSLFERQFWLATPVIYNRERLKGGIEPQPELHLRILSDLLRRCFENPLSLERAMLLLPPNALGTS
jgi:hypothetical protein